MGAVNQSTALEFAVRFTDGSEDLLRFWVGQKESVAHVKNRIRQLRPHLKGQKLRLIYLGRILTDGTYLTPWTIALSEKQDQLLDRHLGLLGEALGAVQPDQSGNESSSSSTAPTSPSSIVSSKGKGKGKAREEGDSSNKEAIWIHCVVAGPEEDPPKTTPRPSPTLPTTKTTAATTTTTTASSTDDVTATDATTDADPGTATTEETLTADPSLALNQGPQGFDRLRDAGFSDEDIASMRQEFHQNRQPTDDQEMAPGDDDEHSRALEDQWMEGLSSQNEPIESTSPQYFILLQGLLLGFCVPLIPFFFFRSHIFSRRMQMAIVAGVLVNILAGIARVLL